ncbi:MAG: hypothetical protein A2Z14_03910 [Chloroflexi bacterium RBG_16_48_8]|nr:MAG: hypothetical protein A2Z14_03910 [Chloroflexi bacterium RBG_16_48_8]
MGFLLIVATFFSIAIPITVAAEALLGLLYAVIRKQPKVVTIAMILLANTITLLPLWMIATFIDGDFNLLAIIFTEIIIWLVESAILYLTQRRSIPFWEAAVLSLILNGTSFLMGLFLPFKDSPISIILHELDSFL